MNKDFDIYDGEVLVFERLFINLFEKIPNIFSAFINIDQTTVLKKVLKIFQLDEKSIIVRFELAQSQNLKKIKTENSYYVIKLAEEILLVLFSHKFEIYYSDFATFKPYKNKIIKILQPTKVSKDKHKANFLILKKDERNYYGYTLQPFEIAEFGTDLKKFYNDDLISKNKEILQFLLENDTPGILILTGKHGTGKTSYLKYLMSSILKNFVVIPAFMHEHLATPDFYFFISEYPESILVLDNCEKILKNSFYKENENPLGVFLDNAQGIFGNNYVFKIICISSGLSNNTNNTILTKSPFILSYEFKPLSPEKANILAEELGISIKFNQPVILSDLFKLRHTEILEADRKLGFVPGQN